VISKFCCKTEIFFVQFSFVVVVVVVVVVEVLPTLLALNTKLGRGFFNMKNLLNCHRELLDEGIVLTEEAKPHFL
jgi:hypothetical protein